jgi:hypothetical protein
MSMAQSRVSGTKKKMGRPRVDSTSINVRVPPAELARLDEWRAEQSDSPSRPETLRRLAAKALAIDLPPELLDIVDAWAASKNLTRSQAIRALIDAGIAASVPHKKRRPPSKRRR